MGMFVGVKMINIAKVKTRLDEIEQLVISYKKINRYPDGTRFLERISEIRNALDLYKGEGTESKKESMDSKVLLKDVEAQIISFMLERLKMELEQLGSKKELIEEHIKFLGKVQSVLFTTGEQTEHDFYLKL